MCFDSHDLFSIKTNYSAVINHNLLSMFLNTPVTMNYCENTENYLCRQFEDYPTIKDKIQVNREMKEFKDITKKSVKNSNHIKIPMNAFMVWAKINRKLMASQYPNFSNLDISKLLGKKWNEMSAEERTPFINEAKQLRIEHLNQYPEFRYQPRRRQKKSKKSKPIKTDLASPTNQCSADFHSFENLNLPKISNFNFTDMNNFEVKNIYDYQPASINYNSEINLFNDYFDHTIDSGFQPIDSNLPSVSSLIYNSHPYTFNYNCEKSLAPFNYLEHELFL